jgi:hypothetical protein
VHTEQRIDVLIRRVDLGWVHWPSRPLVGTGEVVFAELPVQAWPRVTYPVPVGADVARRITVFRRLTRGFAVGLPSIMIPMAVAGAILQFLDSDWAYVLLFAIPPLSLINLVPGVYVRLTRTPRFTHDALVLPDANADALREAEGYNPPGLLTSRT